jgi:protein gp37
MNKQYGVKDGNEFIGIGWCTHTSSPIKYRLKENFGGKKAGDTVWFCVKVSGGCKFCYSERLAMRWAGLPFTVENLAKVEPFIDDGEIKKLLGMKVKPAMRVEDTIGNYPGPHVRPAVFIEDMSDLWGEWIPFEMIDRVMAVAALRPDITFMFLTKRSDRMAQHIAEETSYFDAMLEGATQKLYSDMHPAMDHDTISMNIAVSGPLPNVLLGFSAEDQANFDQRWMHMRTLAAQGWNVFCSHEPALGPIDFSKAMNIDHVDDFGGEIDWLIIGGESGSHARPFDFKWMRSAMYQCIDAGVPIWCKQAGAKPWSSLDEKIDHLYDPCGHQCDCCDECPCTTPEYNPPSREEHPQIIKMNDSHGGDWREWPKPFLIYDADNKSYKPMRELPEMPCQP